MLLFRQRLLEVCVLAATNSTRPFRGPLLQAACLHSSLFSRSPWTIPAILPPPAPVLGPRHLPRHQANPNKEPALACGLVHRPVSSACGPIIGSPVPLWHTASRRNLCQFFTPPTAKTSPIPEQLTPFVLPAPESARAPMVSGTSTIVVRQIRTAPVKFPKLALFGGKCKTNRGFAQGLKFPPPCGAWKWRGHHECKRLIRNWL